MFSARTEINPSLSRYEKLNLSVSCFFVHVLVSPAPPADGPSPDTSLTNFFAFLLGSQSSLPAVEYFCLYASVSILFDFFLQVINLAIEENDQPESS